MDNGNNDLPIPTSRPSEQLRLSVPLVLPAFPHRILTTGGDVIGEDTPSNDTTLEERVLYSIRSVLLFASSACGVVKL